nr:MATE family efflux transporter [uncultured Solibaculum sp.]
MKNNLLMDFAKYVSLNVLGMLGLSCYILADTFFTSARLGTNGLAALNIAISIYSVIHATGLMLGIGGATKYSIFQSQNQSFQANNIFTITVLLGFGFGVLFVLIGLTASSSIAWLLGARGTILEMTGTYLKTILCFGPFFLLNQIFLAFVRNDHAPRLSMLGMIVGSLSNIVLDYVFMFPLNMGIFGAALATGLAPIISMLILSRHRIAQKNHFHFSLISFSFSKIFPIFGLGISSFINEISSAIVLIVFNLLILQAAGNTGVAAYGIVANLALVALAIFTGIAQGAQPLTSRLYGQGQSKNAHKILKYSIVVSVSLGVVLYSIVFLFTNDLVSIFNSENDAFLAQLAFEGLRIYFIGFLFVGVSIVSAAYLAATERPKPSFIISIVRGAVAILVFAIAFSSLWGIHGIWLSFPTSELVTVVLSVLLIRRTISQKSSRIKSLHFENTMDEKGGNKNG